MLLQVDGILVIVHAHCLSVIKMFSDNSVLFCRNFTLPITLTLLILLSNINVNESILLCSIVILGSTNTVLNLLGVDMTSIKLSSPSYVTPTFHSAGK